MKRILLFIDSLGAGGAQRQLTGLAVMLKRRGYAVKVVTYYDHPFYKYILDDDGCEYECLNVDSKLCLPRLVRCIRKFKADVLISYQTDPNALACVAAALTGVKLIVSERNTHLSIGLKDRLIFRLYRLADSVVPNSYSEGDFIRDNFKFLKNKISVISNFVDLDLFTPKGAAAGRPRHILVVASVKASKNTKNFIRAVSRAKERGVDIDVTWYGVNPASTDLSANVRYADECVKLVGELGLGGCMRLLPKRRDIQVAYREADIFCLPSLFEGTPNVICEAMASALPVAASSVCDNAHYVKEGVNGMLFNPGDVDGMADVLVRMAAMTDDELASWGRRSRQIAEELCSADAFVGKYIKIIDSL